jgi:two-component system nitrogen regulation sensor histidine kinase NtrY
LKLKTKYLLYASLIHAIFIAAVVVLYNYNKVLFVISEAGILLSLVLFISFYKTILRPFKLLQAGVESITDKDFSIKFLPVGQPELDRLIDVYNKMIEQLRLERTKTTEKNFFLEKLIAASPAAIIILDKNGQIQTINPVTLSLLNITDKIKFPASIQDLPYPWNTELLNLNETDSIVIQLNGINQYKCYKSYFIDRGVKQSFFIIEELTKELLKAERQSYEKVIRMMSHEVNNSVGAANSIIDSTVHFLLNQKVVENNDFIDVLKIAKERIINLNLFTKRFADIVHIPPPDISEFDIKELIDHVLICFKTEFEQKGIKVKTRYKPEIAPISFDYQQLEMVLINIIKNAVEAIKADGKINIIFQNLPPTLIIENSGEKIPDHIQKKIFKPFFTTKKTGQGIGLTLIREILINHACVFSLKTRIDGITEFKIVFNKLT